MNKQDFFDTHAENWENMHYPPEVRKQLWLLVQDFNLAKGDRVLDVGTGTGILIPYLRRLIGTEGQICAFDLSFQMIKQAFQKPRIPGDVVLRADVHHIPFKSDTFDKVICFAAFPHFSDYLVALCEMSRVLKKGGFIIIAHLLSREELARHHSSHPSVAGDVLPDNQKMCFLFKKAGLKLEEITNIPGRYLAKGIKRHAS